MKNIYKVLGFLTLMLFSSISMANTAQYENLDDIKQSVENFVRSKVTVNKGEQLKVEVGHLDSRLHLAQCEIPLQVFVPSGRRTLKSHTVGVACAGKKPWRIFVPVRVEIYKQVVVSAHPISKGSQLHDEDFKLENMNVMKLRQGFFQSKDQVAGKVLTRSITMGTPITPKLLTAPTVIKKGETVAIAVEHDGLKVQMKGRAMKSGGKGEHIPVRNLSSKRVIDALVTGPSMVTVLVN